MCVCGVGSHIERLIDSHSADSVQMPKSHFSVWLPHSTILCNVQSNLVTGGQFDLDHVQTWKRKT